MSEVTFFGILAYVLLAVMAGIIIYACIKEPPWLELKRLLKELREDEQE